MESESAARLPAPLVDPLTVGKAFVMQYYHILYNMPELLHRFYQENSKVGRVGQDGVMRHFSTLQGITEVLKTLSYGDFKSAEITSYDIQESHDGGFLLVVTGYFALNERLRRKFSQTFFLAPQENGYFVLNDMFRFVNEPKAIDGELVSRKESETHSPAPTGSKQAEYLSVNPVCKEVSKPSNNENASVAKEHVLVPEIINKEVPDIEITFKEVADDSLKMKISDQDDGLEDVPNPKKSYASVLKVTKDKSGVSVGSSLSPKQILKDQERQASSVPSFEQMLKDQEHQASSVPSFEQILKDQEQNVSSDPSPVVEYDAVSEAVDATENGHNHGLEVVAEGTSIYVKHLPTNATIDMLEAEFKQFGVISSGGIQVVNQWGLGYPFGFVEFKEADGAQKAIEASPLMIGGQRAFVEEKRSTRRGNRGSGNGNVGVRGRGNYGHGNNYRRGGGGGGGGGRSFNNRRGNEYVPSLDPY